jgi:hypothetical protein
MGYVAASASAGPLYAELRGERVPVRPARLPFIATTYKR